MRYFYFAILLCFTLLLPAQDDSLAVPNSGIAGLKANLNRLLEDNQIDSALLYTGKLINYYKQEGNYYEELRAAVHKAEILRHISSLEEAENVLQDYRLTADTMKISTVKSVYYNRLAAILFERNNKEGALAAVQRSQKIDSMAGYTWRKYSNWNIEGAIYRDQANYSAARKVLERSAQYALAQKDTSEYVNALYNLSRNYYRAQDYPKAIDVTQRYLKLYPYSFSGRQADVAELGAQAAAALQDYPLAFSLLDSAYTWRMEEMQSIIESRVEAMKMTDDLEKARLESAALRSQKEADQFRIIALAAVLFIAVLIGILFYLSSKNYKQRHAQQADQNRKMKESLEFKDKLISIVAHDIRNPVASIRGMLQLYSEGLVKTNELAEWMDGLETAVANVDLLLENLLNWVKTQRGKIEAKMEKVHLVELIQKTSAELKAQMELKKIDLQIEDLPSQKIKVQADQNILAFAYRNILSNAIKFSPEQGKVQISFTEQETEVSVAISDQGLGMSPEQVKQLQHQETSTSEQGTHAEKGSGLGFSLSQEFLHAINARIDIDSTPGRGTTMTIVIPKNGQP